MLAKFVVAFACRGGCCYEEWLCCEESNHRAKKKKSRTIILAFPVWLFHAFRRKVNWKVCTGNLNSLNVHNLSFYLKEKTALHKKARVRGHLNYFQQSHRSLWCLSHNDAMEAKILRMYERNREREREIERDIHRISKYL